MSEPVIIDDDSDGIEDMFHFVRDARKFGCPKEEATYALFFLDAGTYCDIHGWECNNSECNEIILVYLRNEDDAKRIESIVNERLIRQGVIFIGTRKKSHKSK